MVDLAYDEIKTGDDASLSVTITEAHIVLYAGITGDVNPVHVDAEHAKESMFGERIAHGMLVAAMTRGSSSCRRPCRTSAARWLSTATR